MTTSLIVAVDLPSVGSGRLWVGTEVTEVLFFFESEQKELRNL